MQISHHQTEMVSIHMTRAEFQALLYVLRAGLLERPDIDVAKLMPWAKENGF